MGNKQTTPGDNKHQITSDKKFVEFATTTMKTNGVHQKEIKEQFDTLKKFEDGKISYAEMRSRCG